MMTLRYVLMAGTTAALGFFAYMFATEGPPETADERVIAYSFAVGFILNLVYLYFSHPAAVGKQSRLAKLVWQHEERELRDRSQRSSNSD